MKIEPINVNVKFDVSENFKQTVATLCGAILKLGHSAAAEEPKAGETAKADKQERKAAATEQKPAEMKREEPKAEQPAQAAEPAEPMDGPIPEYSAADVRAAMDSCRKRIEGEDYKEHPDSEGYKQWHRPLTSWFKNTAALYGYEKPSAISDNDKRAAFINDCQRVQISDGELKIETPF